MLTAFWATACLHPATTKPVSSNLWYFVPTSRAAFHFAVPQYMSCAELYKEMVIKKKKKKKKKELIHIIYKLQ